jgi:hypothetical protein
MLQGDLAVVGEVGIHVEAVEQGSPEKWTPAHGQDSDRNHAPIPYDDGLVDVYPRGAIVGEIGGDLSVKWQAEGGNGVGRERQRAFKTGVYDEFNLPVRLIEETKGNPDSRLQADNVALDHGPVRWREPPTA